MSQKFRNFTIKKLLESERQCNKCGKIFVFDYTKMQEDADDIIHPFEAHFGYWSGHDMEHWHFDLCEKCLEELCESFMIEPQINGEDSFGEVPYKTTISCTTNYK